MATDPERSFYGHPLLPAGFNSWEINGTEFNDPGANEPVWPTLFDSFVAMEPLLITDDMMAYFIDGVPDLILAAIDDTVMFRGRQKVVLPPVPQKVTVNAENSDIAFRMEPDTVAAAKPDNNAQMTKRASRLPLRTRTSVLRIRR